MEWTFQFVGGSSELLQYPLEDGTRLVASDVPITTTSAKDARRLRNSPKWKDLTVYPDPKKAEASKPTVDPEKKENDAK